MFTAVLSAVVRSATYTIDSPGATFQTLNNGDKLVVEVADISAELYFRVNPHFIAGNLSLTAVDYLFEGHVTFPLRAGDRYAFRNSKVTITYSDAWGPCGITIWYFNPGPQCPYAIHTRDPISATISFGDASLDMPVCYFFEFDSSNILITVSLTPPTILEMALSDALMDINTSMSLRLPERRFVLILSDPKGAAFNAMVKARRPITDWSDVEGGFIDCFWDTDHQCKTYANGSYGLVTTRSLPSWFWAIIVGAIAIVAVACVFVVVDCGKQAEARIEKRPGGFMSVSPLPLKSTATY
jgi:hypothetical protein